MLPTYFLSDLEHVDNFLIGVHAQYIRGVEDFEFPVRDEGAEGLPVSGGFKGDYLDSGSNMLELFSGNTC